MKKNILWRLLLIGVTVILAVIFFLPNTPAFRYMPEWWKSTMPDKGIVLGLDLQGGLHLVFEVEGEKAVEITTERYAARLKDLLAKKNLPADVKTSGLDITVAASNAETAELVKNTYPTLVPVETSSRLVYRISEKEAIRIQDSATDQALETIRNRI